MKPQTKETISWIIRVLNDVPKYIDKVFIMPDYEKHRKEAVDLLFSLEETESHLCHGGYIQDTDETPCRDGDVIKTKDGTGILYWSKHDSRFYFKRNDTLYPLSNNFKKVEQ